MSGNPRWIYSGDGALREPKDFSMLLAEITASTVERCREQQPSSSPSASSAVRGSESGTGVGVRVPAAMLERLQDRFRH